MLKPAVRQLEYEIGRSTRADGQGARRMVRHERDVNGQATFVNELPAQPPVGDVLAWLNLATVFNAEPYGVRAREKALKGLSIANGLSIGEAAIAHGPEAAADLR